MAMSNLLCFVGALALALAAADYFFSSSAALINRIPLLPTLPRAYIYISSPLFVCAYKLISGLPNLFNVDLGDLFISACAENISSRIISWLIDHFPSFKSNQGLKNRDQINSDQMNGVQMNGGLMDNNNFKCRQTSGIQSSGGQMNGVQMNEGQMYNGQFDIQQSKGLMNNGQFNIQQSEVA